MKKLFDIVKHGCALLLAPILVITSRLIKYLNPGLIDFASFSRDAFQSYTGSEEFVDCEHCFYKRFYLDPKSVMLSPDRKKGPPSVLVALVYAYWYDTRLISLLDFINFLKKHRK